MLAFAQGVLVANMLIRAGTLLFQEQSPTGRVVDVIIISAYAVAAYGCAQALGWVS
jgi:hypothetical protein